MLKRKIDYEDFEGEKQSEIFYFNLTKAELIELTFEDNEDFGTMLKRIINTKNNAELIKRFKQIILMAYGVKSDDGKRFIKNDQLREEFSQTAAYDVLFMELATNDEVAYQFLTGLLPRDLADTINKEDLKQKTAAALGTKTPIPPVPPT